VRGSPRDPDDFLIIGIGASAGGLEAVGKLLEALPDGNGMALILAQHLDPTHQSMMARRLPLLDKPPQTSPLIYRASTFPLHSVCRLS